MVTSTEQISSIDGTDSVVLLYGGLQLFRLNWSWCKITAFHYAKYFSVLMCRKWVKGQQFHPQNAMFPTNGFNNYFLYFHYNNRYVVV